MYDPLDSNRDKEPLPAPSSGYPGESKRQGENMLLKLLDRLLLLKALPKEGSYATLKIVQDLKHNLALNEDEFKEYEVKEEEGNIVWNADKDDGKEIPIGEKATDIIIMALKKRDRDGELTEQEIPVYEKFIKGD